MGVCPVPNPPLFSQGLHFQRSPWDSTPSPHLHVPRKIGSAGACLFAVAGAPVCDYSCSTAGCCGALCASARVPRSASTPVPPLMEWSVPLALSIPGHQSQSTPASCSWEPGQCCEAQMAFSRVPP